MITKIAVYQKIPQTIKTNFNETGKEPARVLNANAADSVNLSVKGIQKAAAKSEQLLKAKDNG